jgi:hypothetical protein
MTQVKFSAQDMPFRNERNAVDESRTEMQPWHLA